MPQPADHEKSAVEVEARSLGISVEAFSGCLAMFQECLTAVTGFVRRVFRISGQRNQRRPAASTTLAAFPCVSR